MNKKKITNKMKLIMILIVLIAMIGIAITATIGLNVDLKYQASQNIELYIEKEFEISDIKSIVNEVMPKTKTIIQKVEVFEDTVSITAKEISEEQKQNIITKVNEKYGINIEQEKIEITNIASEKLIDVIKPYILPLAIITGIILVYVSIRYASLGVVKTLFNTILVLAITGIMFLSIMAIVRIPICEYTMPAGMALYILTLLVITNAFEKKLKLKKEEIEIQKNKKVK